MTDTVSSLSFLTKRKISHDEAHEISRRLINSHFQREPHARASIPARPDYDDDLLITAYIQQQRHASADRDALVKALEDARDALYNGFEPDNQSRAWHRANAALARAKQGA